MLAARQTAWRAAPTLDRLLALVDVATALDQLDPVLSEEADRAGGEPLSRRRDLAAGLLLLAGRVDDAIRLVDATDNGGWDSGRHPAPVVVAFLLTGASDAARHEEWGDSLLLELLDRANNTGWRYDRLRADDGLETLRTTLTDDGAPAAIGRYRA
ncbi:MAG: hypothetical protein EA340_00450, partial [Nitriliruptor sp.]